MRLVFLLALSNLKKFHYEFMYMYNVQQVKKSSTTINV